MYFIAIFLANELYKDIILAPKINKTELYIFFFFHWLSRSAKFSVQCLWAGGALPMTHRIDKTFIILPTAHTPCASCGMFFFSAQKLVQARAIHAHTPTISDMSQAS